MQLKYSFKKELAQFFRTFRFWGIIIVMFSFALSNPLMFKFTASMLDVMGVGGDTSDYSQSDGDGSQTAPSHGTDIFAGLTLDVAANGDTTVTPPHNSEDPMASIEAALGDMGMGEVADMYSDAGLMFAATVTTFSAGPILVIMLLLMSAAGGEQKKRAMIVPMCSGLRYKSYLLPKFVIYPLTVFAITFVSACTAGLLCNALFPNNKVTAAILLLSALLASIYNAFIVSVYLSLGLCTSKPGVMTALLYVGQMLLQTLLNGFGLTDYHPFALLNYIGGEMVAEDFSLAEKTPAIIVSAVLSIVISVMMYFLALTVLNAKKINNQAANEPEF